MIIQDRLGWLRRGYRPARALVGQQVSDPITDQAGELGIGIRTTRHVVNLRTAARIDRPARELWMTLPTTQQLGTTRARPLQLRSQTCGETTTPRVPGPT